MRIISVSPVAFGGLFAARRTGESGSMIEAPDQLANEVLQVKPYGERRAWYAMFVFLIQGLVPGIDIGIGTLLVHPIETSFQINDVAFATMTTVSLAIGTAIAFYPAGLLADTFRRRNVVVAATMLWIVGVVIAARSSSPTMFFVARVIEGMGIGTSAPAIFSMITDAFPRTRRAFALGASSVGLSIGGSFSLTTCWVMVDWTQRHGILYIGNMLFLPWQQCFIISAILGIIALVLVLTVAEPPRLERVTHASANVKSTLRVFGLYMRRHWFLWAMVFVGYQFGGIICFALGTWGPAFGLRQYHAGGVGDITLLGTFASVGSLLGSIGGSSVAQRALNVGKPNVLPRMLTAIQASSCIFAASFPFMPSWLLANVAMAGIWLTASMMAVLISVEIQETAPNEARGQLSALNGFMGFIPQMIGATTVASLATGAFAHSGGLGVALAVVGGSTSVFGIFAFALAHHPYERAHAEIRVLTVSK